MAEIIKSKAKLFNTFRRGTGSIVLQDDTMPLKVPLGNNLGDTVAKEMDMHIVSTDGKLSGIFYSCICLSQLASCD